MIDHGQPIAQTLGLVHEMRRQQDRLAARQQRLQPLPDQMARLRIEPGGRLVHEDQVGIVDQRPRQRQASLHAARQLADPRRPSGGQAGELQQLRQRARATSRIAQPEVATVDDAGSR